MEVSWERKPVPCKGDPICQKLFSDVDFVPSVHKHSPPLLHVRDVFGKVGEAYGLNIRGTFQLKIKVFEDNRASYVDLPSVFFLLEDLIEFR